LVLDEVHQQLQGQTFQTNGDSAPIELEVSEVEFEISETNFLVCRGRWYFSDFSILAANLSVIVITRNVSSDQLIPLKTGSMDLFHA